MIFSPSSNFIYSKSKAGFIKTWPSLSISQFAYLISSISVLAPLNTTWLFLACINRPARLGLTGLSFKIFEYSPIISIVFCLFLATYKNGFGLSWANENIQNFVVNPLYTALSINIKKFNRLKNDGELLYFLQKIPLKDCVKVFFIIGR